MKIIFVRGQNFVFSSQPVRKAVTNDVMISKDMSFQARSVSFYFLVLIDHELGYL